LLSSKKYNYKIITRFRDQAFSIILIFISITSFFFTSCSSEKKKEQKPPFSFADTTKVKDEIKKLVGDNMKFEFNGNFDRDSLQEIAVGVEVTENNNWGIKFAMLKLEDNHLIKTYETKLLDGSFKESLVKKIKLPQYNFDLIYYDSQDYFWGSGGGEVFAYIINFADKETYYAHVFSDSRRTVELYLSKNISNSDLKNYFVSNFSKDYPNLKLTSEDVSLDF
jgi:hypothetical protein